MVSGAITRRGTAALALLLGGCGDPPTFSPDAASLSVTSATSGDPIESDGYTLTVDGGSAHRLGSNASILISPLVSGDHTLELFGINSGCAVNGGNPRTVHTEPGVTAQSIFIVDCSVPGTGRIRVQTYTYGAGTGRYHLELDVGRSLDIGANDRITLFAVPAGRIVMTLTSVPDNCLLFGSNPRTVDLPEGLEIGSQFKVHCFN